MTGDGGKEFVSRCQFFHEDSRVRQGDRIAKGVFDVADPLTIDRADEIRSHEEWDMSMFKANGGKDIPDFRSST